jgi:hypothetical protein
VLDVESVLEAKAADYAALRKHLLPGGSVIGEEAAFGFVRPVSRPRVPTFEFVEWLLVPRSGHAQSSDIYLELSDEIRSGVIKRAHDLEASLVEFHSHPFPGRAAFSGFDLEGLADFVPHVRWRLRGRPYFALVVSPTGFDGLAWLGEAKAALTLGGIAVGGQLFRPTGESLEM